MLGWREDFGHMYMRYSAPVDFLNDAEIAGLEGLCPECVDEPCWFAADFTGEAYRMEGSEVPTHWMPLPRPPIC